MSFFSWISEKVSQAKNAITHAARVVTNAVSSATHAVFDGLFRKPDSMDWSTWLFRWAGLLAGAGAITFFSSFIGGAIISIFSIFSGSVGIGACIVEKSYKVKVEKVKQENSSIKNETKILGANSKEMEKKVEQLDLEMKIKEGQVKAYKIKLKENRRKNKKIMQREAEPFLSEQKSNESSKEKINKDNIFSEKSPSIHPGLQYKAVDGDGNCLYTAVSHYLEKDQSFLRALVSDYIKNNLDEFINFLEEHDIENIEGYLTAIREERAWADNVEIMALMRILNRPIVVMNPNGTIRNVDDVAAFNENPIFVYYNGNDHYNALVVLEGGGYTGEAILTDLRERINVQHINLYPPKRKAGGPAALQENSIFSQAKNKGDNQGNVSLRLRMPRRN